MRKRKRSVQLNNRRGSRRNRILLAFALIAVSISSWLFTQSNEVELNQYLVASSNIPSSTELTSAKVAVLKMDLGEAQNQYLKATEKNLESWVFVRPVSAGDLIPLSAIGPRSTSECVQLVIALGIPMAEAIKLGDRVDLWAADQVSAVESFPTQVVTDAELISSKTPTESFSAATQTIELCVSPAEVRSVVGALARKATLVALRSPF